jgi:hypothetical protein
MVKNRNFLKRKFKNKFKEIALLLHYAPVAQSEERATVNRKVGGSKPPGGVLFYT